MLFVRYGNCHSRKLNTRVYFVRLAGDALESQQTTQQEAGSPCSLLHLLTVHHSYSKS